MVYDVGMSGDNIEQVILRNKGGGKTKFQLNFIDDIKHFFKIDEPFRKEIIEKSKEYFKDGSVKKENEKYKLIPVDLPTLFSFSREVKVAYRTVCRWRERGEKLQEQLRDKEHALTKETLTPLESGYIRFCHAHKEAKEMQKELLINNGLAGIYPPASYIFTAKNMTDMKDKVENDHTNNGGTFRGNTIVIKDFSGKKDEATSQQKVQ